MFVKDGNAWRFFIVHSDMTHSFTKPFWFATFLISGLSLLLVCHQIHVLKTRCSFWWQKSLFSSNSFPNLPSKFTSLPKIVKEAMLSARPLSSHTVPPFLHPFPLQAQGPVNPDHCPLHFLFQFGTSLQDAAHPLWALHFYKLVHALLTSYRTITTLKNKSAGYLRHCAQKITWECH